jgi:hypothetical protein
MLYVLALIKPYKVLAMAEIYLADLPTDHPLRNTSLGEIGAEYQHKTVRPSAWRKAADQGGIKNATFNQLGETWTRWDLWRVKDET